jgi:hypothetical protein
MDEREPAFCISFLILSGIFATFVILFLLYVYFAQNDMSTLFVINNSGKDIVIANSTERKPASIGELVAITCDDFQVRTADDKTWFYQYVGIGLRKPYFQLESDGKIYVIDKRTRKPEKELLEQPHGYPLIPRNESEQRQLQKARK